MKDNLVVYFLSEIYRARTMASRISFCSFSGYEYWYQQFNILNSLYQITSMIVPITIFNISNYILTSKNEFSWVEH